MKVEFHCHTERSFDCDVAVEKRISQYAGLGFDRLYITDHDRCLPRKYRSNDTGSLAVLSGVEVSTYMGHVILLDCPVRPPVPSLWFLVLWAKIFRSQLYIPHPCRPGSGFFAKLQVRAPSVLYIAWFLGQVSFVEVWNPRDKVRASLPVAPEVFEAIKRVKFVTASDAHFDTDIHSSGSNIDGLEVDDIHVQEFLFKKIHITDDTSVSHYQAIRAAFYALGYCFLGYRPQ